MSMDQTIRIIVGLGNPGEEYRDTRHNIGFELIDRLADDLKVSFKRDRKCKALIGFCTVNGIKIVFVKPETYMNLSGICVRSVLNFYKVELKNLLVISDDVEIDVGRVKLKARGSTGGHNGLKSITDELGSIEYTRLRIGVGLNKQMSLSDFVLGRFSNEELVAISEPLEIAKRVTLEWAFYGFGAAEMLLTRLLSQKNNSSRKEGDNNMEKSNG
jgi:PTH1 family peptidyl-tRNA hydrolase